jgi:hypothetical protein
LPLGPGERAWFGLEFEAEGYADCSYKGWPLAPGDTTAVDFYGRAYKLTAREYNRMCSGLYHDLMPLTKAGGTFTSPKRRPRGTVPLNTAQSIYCGMRPVLRPYCDPELEP